VEPRRLDRYLIEIRKGRVSMQSLAGEGLGCSRLEIEMPPASAAAAIHFDLQPASL
jgi:hypothetical protein